MLINSLLSWLKIVNREKIPQNREKIPRFLNKSESIKVTLIL